MDRVLVNQGARGRLASDSLKDFSNLALASLSLTNTTGLAREYDAAQRRFVTWNG